MSVSVIIPCHNAGDYIGPCLESVRAQTERDWEALVVDDGSSDQSVAIVRSLADADTRIRLLRHDEKQGAAAARNAGLRATAGELVVGFANTFVWQFAGPDTNVTNSLLNFTFMQPLLRGAGRDIALEQLTIVERALLANMRAYTQWRQGFFTDIAIGENGVPGPRRRGGFFGGTGLAGFQGQGAGGFGGVGAATFGRGFGGGGGGFGGGGASGGW